MRRCHRSTDITEGVYNGIEIRSYTIQPQLQPTPINEPHDYSVMHGSENTKKVVIERQ